MMRKFTIYLDEELSFSIDNYKVLFGDNYYKKFKFINKIKYLVSNNNINTEEINNNILVDNEVLNLSGAEIININSNFDLKNEMSLTSKSLLQKYLINNLEKTEFDENFYTAKTILNDIDFDNNIVINNFNLSFKLEDFNYRSLLKLIKPFFYKDDENVNVFELGYEELILLQLKLLKSLYKNITKPLFVFIECYLNKNILKEINSIRSNKNLFVFIITNQHHNTFCLDNYLLINKNNIDLYDDISYYYIKENINTFIENKENVEIIVKKYIEGFNYYHVEELKKIL